MLKRFEAAGGWAEGATAVRPRCKSACLVLALLVSVGFCALASDKPKIQGPLTQTKVAEYLIGPDDILAVQVWKEPEISRNVLVRPDGNISLPLIGDVRAGGRTPVQLQDDIKQQLRNYLASPEVVVIVQEAKSRKFNILGQVERPGSYPMSRSMTVLDAIAVAGGFRDFAKEGKIYILRVKANGSFLRLPFNYKEVIRGQRLSQNVELEPRDTVIVP